MEILGKKFLPIVLIGLLGFGFVACDNDEEPAPTTDTTNDGTNDPDSGGDNGSGGDDGSGGDGGSDGDGGSNDKPPVLSVNTPEIIEGGNIRFEFELNEAGTEEVSIKTSTDNIVAQNGLDYVGFASKMVTIPVGETKAFLEVRTMDDTVNEIDEKFRLNIEQVTGATLATNFSIATILDND